jgi:hypothetical protein
VLWKKVLQNVSHVINPNWWQLLPKGRTPWGPCVLHYIYIYLCNKESILCHLSLLFSILPLSTAIDHNTPHQLCRLPRSHSSTSYDRHPPAFPSLHVPAGHLSSCYASCTRSPAHTAQKTTRERPQRRIQKILYIYILY